jgi:hypothetical protein
MKLLYTNGDSWTHGEEIVEPLDGNSVRYYNTWPWFLCQLTNIPLCVNDAVGAGSNDRIFRRTSEFILNWIGQSKDPKNLTIVLGWSTPERTEIALKDRHCRITTNAALDSASGLVRRFQNVYYSIYDDEQGMLKQVRYMTILRMLCKNLGIAYYDFIAMGDQPDIYNTIATNKFNMPLYNLYGPTSWKKYAYLNKHTVYTHGHPTIESQKIWAEQLKEFFFK